MVDAVKIDTLRRTYGFLNGLVEGDHGVVHRVAPLMTLTNDMLDRSLDDFTTAYIDVVKSQMDVPADISLIDNDFVFTAALAVPHWLRGQLDGLSGWDDYCARVRARVAVDAAAAAEDAAWRARIVQDVEALAAEENEFDAAGLSEAEAALEKAEHHAAESAELAAHSAYADALVENVLQDAPLA